MNQRFSASRILYLVLILALLSLFTATPAAAAPQPVAAQADTVIEHLIYDITFNLYSPNILRTNQDLTFNFKYTTNRPGGIRVFGRPFTNGDLTPNYGAHGSPIYPTGTGNGSGFFTITSTPSGQVVVDGIRFQIYNADQSVLLYETVLPVHYLFTNSPNAVHSLQFLPVGASTLSLNQNVSFNFAYTANNPGGVRIFGRPMTGNDLTPAYGAHGSGVYPVGTGSGSGFFTITAGAPVLVDGIRFQVVNPDQTLLLFEAVLPVHYQYDDVANMITGISVFPPSPNILLYGEDVTISFSYKANNPGGVRIFARPLSGSDLTPDYAAHGSPIHPTGTGSVNGFFRINSGPALVDGIRIQVTNADQTVLLYETVIPVHYQYGPYVPPEPAIQSLLYMPLLQK